MSLAADVAKSVIGMGAQAQLVLHDFRNMPKSDAKSAEKALDGISPFSDLGVSKVLYVQFNPSSIQINASSNLVDKSSMTAPEGQKKGDTATTAEQSGTPTVTMSVTLLFDQVTNANTFMADKITNGISVQSIKNLVDMTKEIRTVRTEVEGLLGAIRNRNTRLVSFNWGEFTFDGKLSNIRAEYKTFTPEGVPVRAEVTLRLDLVQTKDVTDKWVADYNKTFDPSPMNKVKKGIETVRSAGNILNF